MRNKKQTNKTQRNKLGTKPSKIVCGVYTFEQKNFINEKLLYLGCQLKPKKKKMRHPSFNREYVKFM